MLLRSLSLESAAGSYLVPKVFLFGDYQRYNNVNNRAWLSDPAFRDAYDFGIGLSWNLFDGAASLAKSKEAVEQSYQAEKTVEAAELHSHRDFELWQRKYLYFCNVYGARIGDLCVFGDKNTVFGELDQPNEELPSTYRSHGSMHELDIPLFVYNAKGAPPSAYFEHNRDLTRWLYRG